MPVLAERLLAFHARNNHRSFLGFKEDALRALTAYAWPGNVRELSNAVERAAILCPSDRIGLECLPANLSPGGAEVRIGDPVSLDKLEESHIRRVLASARSLRKPRPFSASTRPPSAAAKTVRHLDALHFSMDYLEVY